MVVKNAVKLAEVLGGEDIDDIKQDKANNLLDAHSKTLRDKNLLVLMKSASEKEGLAPDPEGEEVEMGLTIKRLSDFLRTAKELLVNTEAWDPYKVRSHQLKN